MKTKQAALIISILTMKGLSEIRKPWRKLARRAALRRPLRQCQTWSLARKARSAEKNHQLSGSAPAHRKDPVSHHWTVSVLLPNVTLTVGKPIVDWFLHEEHPARGRQPSKCHGATGRKIPCAGCNLKGTRMNQPVEALRHPWMPVFRPVEGYRGERCQGDPAEGLYLGSITYSDCGVWDVELRYYMSTAGKGPCTYHLFEISDYGSGLKHLGYMEGDAPDHITAGLALWEAMLTGRDPRFLNPKAIVPGPSFSSEQAKELLERVETSHMRALHPEAFPDLREQMLSSAQNPRRQLGMCADDNYKCAATTTDDNYKCA